VDDKRRLILDQALALVDERGLAAMSMRAVAERVGLTSMALYPYVGGKDAMLDGLVDLLQLELDAAYRRLDLSPPDAAATDAPTWAAPGGARELATSEGGARQLATREGGARQLATREGGARQLATREGGARQLATSEGGARQPAKGGAGTRPPAMGEGGSGQLGTGEAEVRQSAAGRDGARQSAPSEGGVRQSATGGDVAGPDLAGIAWDERLRALGRAVRGLAQAHPGAFPLLINRPAAGAAAAWLTAALLTVLHDAGVPAGRAPRVARMICAYLLGYATGEVTGGLPAHDGEFDANLDDLIRLVEVAVRVG
jgi:AcrR family transcriptional regulator